MLTFILATLGKRNTLDRAVQSVYAQTVPAELIIVHDQQRAGAGPSRNSVVNEVQTPWVGFVDDDDTVDPHYAQWLAEEAQDNDVVIFHMQYMQDVHHTKQGTTVPRDDQPLGQGNVGISFAMKTELLKKHPFIREGFSPGSLPSEDWAMIQTLQNAGYKIKISPRIAYYVRPPVEKVDNPVYNKT